MTEGRRFLDRWGSGSQLSGDRDILVSADGMSLRDWLAGQALAGLGGVDSDHLNSHSQAHRA